MGGKGKEGKGGRRRKDLEETESFPIDVDSAVVAVCNLSFTLSDFPEKKKTKEGREERGKGGETNRWDNCKKGGNKRVGVPEGTQEKERRGKGEKDLLGEKGRG
jgi:hypothetical protein